MDGDQLPQGQRAHLLRTTSHGDAVCRTGFIEDVKRRDLTKGELEVRELHSGDWCLYERLEEVAKVMIAWLKSRGSQLV